MNVCWQIGSLKQEYVFKNTYLNTIRNLPCRSREEAYFSLWSAMVKVAVQLEKSDDLEKGYMRVLSI